jgi:hypothetical protein
VGETKQLQGQVQGYPAYFYRNHIRHLIIDLRDILESQESQDILVTCISIGINMAFQQFAYGTAEDTQPVGV